MAYYDRDSGSGTGHFLEVLDRVLDRGIVIDAEITVNVVGLRLAGIEARIVVAAIETYLESADALGSRAPTSWRSVAYEPVGPAFPATSPSPHPPHRFRRFLDGEWEEPA